jgi:hypothetical protein
MEEKLSSFENQVNQLLDDIQRHNLNQSQIQNTLLSLQQQMNTIKSQVDMDKQKNTNLITNMSRIFQDIKKTYQPKYKSIEDIPGVRIPRWYDVNIDVLPKDERRNEIGQYISELVGTIGINPDGPFVVTQITPLWQVLDIRYEKYANPWLDYPGNPIRVPIIGRYLPISANCLVSNNLGRTNSFSLGYNTPSLSQLDNQPTTVVPPVPEQGILTDIPEFDLEIKITGNGRLWNDQPSVGHAFYGDGGQPLYTGIAGIFEKNDRITVLAKEKVDVRYYGRLKLSFHGYQILNPIVVADLIGY